MQMLDFNGTTQPVYLMPPEIGQVMLPRGSPCSLTHPSVQASTTQAPPSRMTDLRHQDTPRRRNRRTLTLNRPYASPANTPYSNQHPMTAPQTLSETLRQTPCAHSLTGVLPGVRLPAISPWNYTPPSAIYILHLSWSRYSRNY